MRIHTIVGTVALASCLAATGCRKPQPVIQAEEPTADTTVTEESSDGTVAWDIATDGNVRAYVKAKDGQAVTQNIGGTVVYPGDVADQERELTVDEKGTLVAAGPPLQDELTEVDYNLTVDGNPWTGVLHVPQGGTKAIDEDAKASAALSVPPGKTGPNGGVIQYIGGDPVELVADKDSHEVRMYVLDSNYAVTDPGERSFRLGYDAQVPGMEVLVREPGADYYVGPWYATYDPFRVTVVMGYGGFYHTGIIGWHYGDHLRFGIGAPVLGYVGVRGWAPSLAVRAGVGFGFGFGVGVGVGFGIGGGWHGRGGVGFGPGVRVGGGVAVGGRGHEGGGHGHEGGGHEGGGHGHEGGGHEGGGHGHEGGGHEGGGHEGGGHEGGHEGGGSHGGHQSEPAGHSHGSEPGGHSGGAGHSGGGHAAPSHAAPSRGGGGRRH
jgi:hypothetical protein